MLAIKLQRIGKKHQPSYRVVVAPKRSKLGSPPVEDLGSYNPFTKQVIVKKERAAYWIGVGAKPTPTAHNLLVREGVIPGPKIAIKVKTKPQTEGAGTQASPETEAPAA